MSRISQDFINNIGYLYEEINLHHNDFLNEDSEYYDQEATEIVEDIISTISVSMIYEGYSAEGVIGFLADSSEEEIIEKYLSFDESILTESIISEEYIEEQLEILNEALGALFRVGKALVKGAKYAKGAKGAAPLARMASGLKSAGTATERIAKQGPKASSIVRSTFSKGVQKVKDIAKGAKAALTSPTAKKVALGAAGLGAVGLAGGIGGYTGAKLAGAGSGQKDGGKSTSSETPSSTKDDFLKGSSLAKLGGKEGRIKGGEFRTMAWSPESRARYAAAAGSRSSAAPSGGSSGTGGGGAGGGATTSQTGGSGSRSSTSRATPSTQTSTPSSNTSRTSTAEPDYSTWAKANPSLAAKVKPGQAGYDVISSMRDKPSSYEKQDQTPTQGSPTAQIDTKSVEADMKAEQERIKKKMEQQKSDTTTTKESYEPYDILLDYLIGRGHADTIEEANYIMLEMDEYAIGLVMEEYEKYLIAEEVSEWVDGLLEEGYDLSEYTWDDIIEYYVNEAREDEGLTPLQKIRKRNKSYAIPGESAGQQTSNRRAERSSRRGVKKSKGEKSAFGTMRHVGGPYK
jgi:hypothetical protein